MHNCVDEKIFDTELKPSSRDWWPRKALQRVSVDHPAIQIQQRFASERKQEQTHEDKERYVLCTDGMNILGRCQHMFRERAAPASAQKTQNNHTLPRNYGQKKRGRPGMYPIESLRTRGLKVLNYENSFKIPCQGALSYCVKFNKVI